MKTTILLLIISFSVFSQTKHPDTDFYLENNKVFWQHVYDAPGTNPNDLIKDFEKEVLTNFKQDNFQIIDNTISFEIHDDKVDYKKYGGTTMGSVLFVSYSLKYLVVIDFKEDKYRVTVKEIYLDNNNFRARSQGDFTEYITKKSSTLFQTNNLITKGMIYFDKHFSEKFDILNKPKQDNNW